MLDIVLIVLTGLLLGVVALVVIGLWRVRTLRAGHRARLDAVRPEHSAPATLVGVASDGKAQTRGVGTLAIGATHLLFVQLVPQRDVLVARRNITSTSTGRHFLGKTTGRDLLVVTWDEDGAGDAAAFDTPDVAGWRARLA